jgi:hypothetical protein
MGRSQRWCGSGHASNRLLSAARPEKSRPAPSRPRGPHGLARDLPGTCQGLAAGACCGFSPVNAPVYLLGGGRTRKLHAIAEGDRGRPPPSLPRIIAPELSRAFQSFPELSRAFHSLPTISCLAGFCRAGPRSQRDRRGTNHRSGGLCLAGWLAHCNAVRFAQSLAATVGDDTRACGRLQGLVIADPRPTYDSAACDSAR